MNARTLKTAGYWLCTGAVALDFCVAGASQIARAPQVVAALAHLGYPPCFVAWLGAWKLLGALALVTPGYPRLKDWAYAGVFFDLTSAVVSSLMVGDGLGPASLPLLFLILTLASWSLRPAGRSLTAVAARKPLLYTLSPSLGAV